MHGDDYFDHNRQNREIDPSNNLEVLKSIVQNRNYEQKTCSEKATVEHIALEQKGANPVFDRFGRLGSVNSGI